MAAKPEIFVSSSSEAKEIDDLIRKKLEYFDATVKSWKDIGTFKPGHYPLDVLLELPPKIDAALLIATADDLTDYRGQKRISPRDNIVLEMGIFLAQLGKYRTGIVLVKDKNKGYPELPSNLFGLTTLKFDPEYPLDFEGRLSNWLEDVKSLKPKSLLLEELNSLILPKLQNTPEKWSIYLQQYIVDPFRQAIDCLSRGELLLSIGVYYHSLYAEIDAADSSTEIMAVSTLSSRIWTQDKEQQQYLKRNIEASSRGANIYRLFILQPKNWGEFKKVLDIQKESNIHVKIVDPHLLPEVEDLKDMVIFKDKKSNTSRIYIVDEVLGNPNRIYGAMLILEPVMQKRLIDLFQKSWKIPPDYSEKNFSTTFSKMVKIGEKAPGENMEVYSLEHPVISCEEAANAKGIPLRNELKSLILQTSLGIVCLHSTGDAKISLHAVKEILEVKQAFIAPFEKLNSLGLSPGTVSALLEPVWSLPHLISRNLLKQKYVSTNNGTLRGYFKFDPRILLSSSTYKIGDFEYSDDSNDE